MVTVATARQAGRKATSKLGDEEEYRIARRLAQLSRKDVHKLLLLGEAFRVLWRKEGHEKRKRRRSRSR